MSGVYRDALEARRLDCRTHRHTPTCINPGNPEARVDEVVDQTRGKVDLDELKAAIEASVGGKGELTRLLASSAQDLLAELEKLNLVTMMPRSTWCRRL